MKSSQTVIGVNLEAPNIQIGLIKAHKLEKLIETKIDPTDSKKNILNHIISLIRKLINNDVVAIGLGIPGIVDSEKGFVNEVPRIKSWKNFALNEEIFKQFNIPCFLNNDANCFTLGVKYFGLGKKSKDIVGLIIGEGVGAGIVIDNKLYSGANSYAGELGRIAYEKGNFEKYVSGTFFKDYHDSDFKDVLAGAKDDNQKTLRIFKEYGHNLGALMENIILTINPELVVIGGELSEGFTYFEKSMLERLDGLFKENPFIKVQIRERRTDNLAVLGAAALYYDDMQTKVLEIEQQMRKRAEQETTTILENVDEGIFLIDKSLKIGTQYSKTLEKILDCNELAGLDFLKHLQNRITMKDLESAKNFMEFLFDDSIDEDTIFDLNPFNPIEISVPKSDELKSLIFQFKRIQNKKGKTEELFAWVKDVTAQKQLEEKVKKSELKAKRQTELVLGIISVEPKLLEEFISSIKSEFELLDNHFGNYQNDKNYKVLLNKLYQVIHFIKGNASILKLKLFAESAHLFEDKISKIQEQDLVRENDIKNIWRNYQEIKDDVTELQSLLTSIGELHLSMSGSKDSTDSGLITTLQNYVKETSNDLNKKVSLNVDKFKIDKIPNAYKALTRDLLIQLIRNSIAHGLEKPEDRFKSGKDKTGNLIITSNINKDCYSFSVYDDGKGLQMEKLKQKMQQHSNWADIEIDKLSKSEIIESIFHPGFSTSEKIDLTSGRGIGMDAVRGKILSHNGSIKIDTEESKYCNIIVELPSSN